MTQPDANVTRSRRSCSTIKTDTHNSAAIGLAYLFCSNDLLGIRIAIKTIERQITIVCGLTNNLDICQGSGGREAFALESGFVPKTALFATVGTHAQIVRTVALQIVQGGRRSSEIHRVPLAMFFQLVLQGPVVVRAVARSPRNDCAVASSRNVQG